MRIHPTAVVDPRARLADDVEIGAYSVVGPYASLGSGCRVENHVTITGHTTMGADCHVHSGAAIGGVPQDLKYRGEETELVMGSHNTIREFVTINAGTASGGGRTVIGDHNLFMAYVHIAHDCQIGSRIVLANVATLGGHISVEDGVRISGLAAVHHFVTIGTLAFVGGCAKVVRDVPPFVMVDGNPARIRGLNLEGLKRSGVGREEIQALKEAYRLLYRSDYNRSQAVEVLRREGLAERPHAARLIRFLVESEQGRSGRAKERLRSEGRETASRDRQEKRAPQSRRQAPSERGSSPADLARGG
jgi:UDP-N-acetylglucosamine acyltransferase